MSFDSQHGARPMGGGRKEGRDGRSFGTPGTHGVSRALYGIWPRFLLRVLIYGDSGKAAASRGGEERERDGSGRKENDEKRRKRGEGGAERWWKTQRVRRRIRSSCRREERRREKGGNMAANARNRSKRDSFSGGQEARNWQSAKKEIVGKVVWLARRRRARTGSAAHPSVVYPKPVIIIIGENGEGNSESRPDQLFLFSFFFLTLS